MKVLIDLDSLTPPLSGVGHYTRQLSGRLALREEIQSLTGMIQGSRLKSDDIRTLVDSLNTDEKHAGFKKAESHPGTRGETLAQLRRLARQLPAARAIWHRWKSYQYHRSRSDLTGYIYWEPNFLLKPFDGPSVLTVHDLSFLVHPEFHPESRLRQMDKSFGPSLEKASRIIAVSRFTRDAIRDQLDIPAEKIDIVTPAAGDDFGPTTAEDKIDIKQRYKLPNQFILSVGTLEPRKNLSRLLSAYEMLPDKLRGEWPLVCVGGRGWNDKKLSADVERLQRRGELIRLSYVPQQDLPAITAAASLMAYVSVYEGFGMPVAEAMACEVPVLTSLGTSMVEVAGQNAFYTDPYDIDQIAQTLREALESPERRARFASNGPEQARNFDWDISADHLISSFRRCES